MKTLKGTRMGKLIASCLALTLATGLVPAGGIAFAQEAAGQIISKSVPLNADAQGENAAEGEEPAATDSAQAEEPAPANAANDGSASSSAAQEAAPSSASAAPAAPAAPDYTNNAIDRISADVPVTAADAVVVGNVEYEGLTYRINSDGQTASLVGLGTAAPKGDLAVPAQIAAGSSLYKVTNIGTSKKLGGGGSPLLRLA